MKVKFRMIIKAVGELIIIIMEKNIVEFSLMIKFMDMADTISYPEQNMKEIGAVV